MPQLSPDDITRAKTLLEGLKARVKEITDNTSIEPETKQKMLSSRGKQIKDIEAVLKGAVN